MLVVKDLRFRWPGQSQWLIDIPHFALETGERLFLRGASGCGKSTLLGLLAGINAPNEGSLHILGSALTSMKGAQRDAFRADNLGYIFQQFNLLPYLSVADNVTLPCRFSKARKQKAGPSLQQEAARLLSALGLAEDCLNKPVTELSIGQQQRVAAARALIGKPALILADEPTSALDSDTRNAFISLLMQECENAGSSLLFVSHDSSLESQFDRAISLPELNQALIQREAS